MKRYLFFALLLVLLLSFSAWAAPIKEIPYTKKVTLTAPKTYTFKFSFYDAESGGTEIWSEEKSINLTGAKLPTILGDTVTFDEAGVDFSQQLWVQVERLKKGGYVPVGTRDRLGVVPYSLWSGKSDSAGSVDVGVLTGTLPVTNGGTGATTTSGARSSLGAAASGANSDITSLSGLISPLSVSQGGTGSDTQSFVDLTTDQTIGGTKTFSIAPSSNQFVSTAAPGTAPLQVASTTMVNNFNAEMVGGKKVEDLAALFGTAAQSARPTTTTISTVDAAGTVGLGNSITIGTDGFPVISYWDETNNDLKVAKCANAACSASTLTTVDSSGDIGQTSSITIGTDGFPVISYYDFTNGDLKVAKCLNATCSASTLTTVDSAGYVGEYTSITIGTDGFPVISYYDYTKGLKVAKCANAACSASTLTTVDSAGYVGEYTSITIGTDGFPVISYLDETNGDLKVAKCSNASCSASSTITVDSAGYVGFTTSITIGTDGFPVISYQDFTNGDLKVAKCSNEYCLNNWRRR